MELRKNSMELRMALGKLDSLMVAYSGGTDSAYLAYEAHQMLGERMLAVIADSPSLPRGELAAALDFAAEHGIPVHILQTRELDDPNYARNDGDRCFHCKDELFTQMEAARGKLGFAHIAYGRNLDDDGDLRPGQRAAAMHHALAPLAEAKLTKLEIRTLAREAGLKLADKPASACLSSRIEYGRHGDGGESEPGGARRGCAARAGLRACAGAPPRRAGAGGDCARGPAAGADAGRCWTASRRRCGRWDLCMSRWTRRATGRDR